MSDRPVAPATRKSKALGTIGQLLSALDDRNPSRALRVLEPESESAEPDGNDVRCVRCATRGE